MDAAFHYFENLIITRDSRISVWLKKENEIYAELESYKNITDLEKILDTYLVATLFNPTINYRLHASTANLGEAEVSTIQHELEITRSRSFYPFLMDNVMPHLFKKVGELIGVDEVLVKNMTPSEMRSVIRGKGAVTAEELQKREDGCYFYVSPDSSTKFYYRAIKSLEKEVEAVNELKGNAAYKGFVVGKVCIVNSTQNMDKFTEGDVLVSINTNPSLMPIIQKASAIVTDEGGITCHAAIVSRELKKPCIIGTKIATKVLKDGDRVEVDADNGVVRILSTNKSSEIQSADSVTLTKIFSREKPLLYFMMWNDSDRLGFKKFLSHEVKHNAFIVPPRGSKGSVWYEEAELHTISGLVEKKLGVIDSTELSMVMETLESEWEYIFPYLDGVKVIQTADDFTYYYEHLVKWWSAMTTAFEIPNMSGVDEKVKDIVLNFRSVSEKYTEKMSKTMVSFVERALPEIAHVSFYVTPKEVIEFAREGVKDIANIEKRIQGVFVLDEQVVLLSEKELVLKAGNITLEEVNVSDTVSIQGSVAFKGHVTGNVRVVRNFVDLSTVRPGEVLVTEMTNPDYVPSMKIASAVVTDEGGMTCHAAIACREFQIPCIVGTKVATQVLKTGDVVEVDADNGVVRILKQENHYFKPEEYQRMFAGPSFALLMSDIFLRYYSSLNVLSVQDKTQWMSFIPKQVVEDTQIEGEKLYTNEISYRVYKDSFSEYMNSAQALFESLLSKQTPYSGKDVEEFVLKAAEHFSYYSKTEFFYTDKINHRELIPTIAEFDELKLQGRSFLNKILFEDDGYLIPFIKKLSQQTSQVVENLMLYSVDELILLVDKNKALDHVTISLRKEGFIVSKVGLHYGQEYTQNIQDLLNVYRGKSDVIKGTIANKGKVTGLARVLLPDFSDFKKIRDEVERMQDGEILVAETTAPEIIAACKKASGIITNQGGMLSHAAIVSRELNIPCIVGADKDVTANIKTGDRVELDADNGIVRIIE